MKPENQPQIHLNVAFAFKMRLIWDYEGPQHLLVAIHFFITVFKTWYCGHGILLYYHNEFLWGSHILTFGTWGLNSTALWMASTAFISAVLSPRRDAASGENLKSRKTNTIQLETLLGHQPREASTHQGPIKPHRANGMTFPHLHYTKPLSDPRPRPTKTPAQAESMFASNCGKELNSAVKSLWLNS